MVGAGDLEPELLGEAGLLPGDFYDPEEAQAARARLEVQPEVDSVKLATELTAEGGGAAVILMLGGLTLLADRRRRFAA